MKSTTFISCGLFMLLSLGVLSAQVSIERQVIGVTGGFADTPNLKVSDTVGETAVSTVISGTVILTQGFQQPGENEITDLEEAIELSYRMYPNPTSDLLTVEVSLDQPLDIVVEVFDLSGRAFPEMRQTLNAFGSSKASLSLAHLPTGIYLLSLKSTDGQVLATRQVQKLP